MAELVADHLRERILSGDLRSAERLPNQERLLADFGVPRQALREGLRILELEGLVSVHRGNVGGATVHLPTPRETAYGLGLVLQGRHVALSDLGAALAILEPLCVRLAAEREDRKTETVPQLKELNAESEASISDIPRFMDSMSRFHRTVVAACGNETLAVTAGAIEELWLAQVGEWSVEASLLGGFPTLEYRQSGIREHQKLTQLIEAGDAVRASRLAAAHFKPQQFYSEPMLAEKVVHAAGLRNHPGSLPLRGGGDVGEDRRNGDGDD